MTTWRGKVPFEDKARMVELYRAGMRINDIAHKVGWSPCVLYRHLKAVGEPLRPRKTKPRRGSIMARARKGGLGQG